MTDVINEYQKWKQQGEDLRVQAKQAMESRFRELLVEAASIAEEYRSDFGGPLKPPPSITAFRYKAGGHKAKKALKKGAAPAKAAPYRMGAAPARVRALVVGARAGLFGDETGRFEAWVYPLKIFRGFHLTFHVGDRALPAESLSRTLTVHSESASILYAGDSFRVRETLFVPINAAAAEAFACKIDNVRQLSNKVQQSC